MGAAATRERNADRTRDAILDAAERLFAERGFNNTTLSHVGAAAGVSRGTPGYFFGTKAALYDAVLDRCFAQAREAVRAGRARAEASREQPEVILAGAVADYYDFLASRPHFVRLIERAALGDGPEPAGRARLAVGHEALAAIAAEVGLDPSPSGEAAQLLLSIIALCWFPTVHAGTVAAAVEVDLSTAEARERRKRHVINLVLHGVRWCRAVTPSVSEVSV
jgi:AcrR family transcriptional regulator